MMERATASAALAIVAGFACAQTQDLVFTQKNDEPSGTGTRGGLATAPHVGVGSDAVVVPANRRLAIYDKAANQLELWNIAASSPAFPFQADPLHGPDFGTMLFDPQAGYDPIADRLWMVYLEGTISDDTTPGLGPEAYLHLAVNKDPAEFGGGPLNTLADTHWHYYTHDTGTGTKAGAEYDLTLLPSPYLPYQGEAGHLPAEATVRMPSIGFDEQAIIVAVNESDKFFGADDNSPLYLTGDELYNTLIFILPRNHTGGTITDGDRPSENEITLIRMEAAKTSLSDRVEDKSEHFRAVQEPFPNPSGPGLTEQVENATFFISMADEDDTGTGTFDSIRLRGIYDADPTAATDWTLQQQTMASSGSFDLLDLNVGRYAHPTTILLPYPLPDTPDTAGWEPNAYGGYFQTAVLARDVNNDFRIFAVHAIQEGDSSGPLGHWIVQWYVIDPHLAGFGTTPDGWQPSIVTQGRLDMDGDRYHPVIVVNRQGQAFIEYTYSNATSEWPEVRRVRLDSTYTGIVGMETQVKGGPSTAYTPLNPFFGNWADYADAQADPFDTCRYWSTHTLVHREPVIPVPALTNKRDVWLFRQLYGTNCFQSPAMLDLNDDNEVDAFDAAAFTPLYDRRARRVDIDGSGTVDAIDMALYFDAFDAYTRGR